MASRPVTNLDAERFDRIEAEREALLVRLADNERRMKAFCARYSDANGFNIRLRADQVRRDLAVKAERMGEMG